MIIFDEFERYLEEKDRAETTIRGYLADLRLFAKWFLVENGEALTTKNWVSSDVRRYREHLLAQGMKPQTINRRLAAVASFGNWSVQAGHLGSNPALHIRSVATAALSPKWLEKKEKAALVRAAEKDVQFARTRYPRLWISRLRDATLLILLLNTGLRVGEFCALDVGDLKLSERKGSVTVRSGKGQKQRLVPLNAEARIFLQQWLLYRPVVETNALFIGQRGERVTARSVQRAAKRLAKAAEISNVTPHVLRHTFAKSLLDSGVGIEKVAALLGHSDLNTTRIYVMPSEGDLEEAVRTLG
ncbi:MAG: tyrosine-type recombinase/integrase [Anaerolineae bacterium]|jgi:site-specific recombinase XerD|nr:tyrosine-type recombinase/integrase [Anaerolineae bacterium]MBT7190107.1 tyrosine-type recombinase/integrase [Anaerolineae bacterium]MBT7325823.1 tyrosine-type recombinase/integrase [Anaerolineae bacterium]